MKKKSVQEEIESFLKTYNFDKLICFLGDVIPLLELFWDQEENDWITEEVGKEDERNVRLARMVYLLSRIADLHTGSLLNIKVSHKDLWKRMQQVC